MAQRTPRSGIPWPHHPADIDLREVEDFDALSPYRVLVDWDQIEGRWEPVAIQIKTVRPELTGPITGTVIRAIPVGRIVARARGEHKKLAQRVVFKGEVPEGFVEAWETGKRPKLGQEFYEQVAAVYQAAFLAGQAPTKAVAEWGSVSASTAASWVSRARNKYDLLPKTPNGKASI